VGAGTQAGTGSRELFTLSVLAIALGVAFGAAALFGVSFALGAFFAGMLLNESEAQPQGGEPIRCRCAMPSRCCSSSRSGMLFDPRILIEQPLPVLATWPDHRVRQVAAAWSRSCAVRHPQHRADHLRQPGADRRVLLHPGRAWASPEGVAEREAATWSWPARCSRSCSIPCCSWRWTDGRPASRNPRQPPRPSAPGSYHTIVVGYGRVGRELSALLRQRGVPVLVVDDDPDLIARAHAEGFAAVRGNAAADRVLAETQAERACIAAVAIPNALEAGEVVAKLRALNPALVVFARAHGEAELKHLLEHGADGAVLAERELAHSMAEMALATPPYRGRSKLASPAPAAGAPDTATSSQPA
jgi:CPA2 family monovalent cation:H+ antiporter-2